MGAHDSWSIHHRKSGSPHHQLSKLPIQDSPSRRKLFLWRAKKTYHSGYENLSPIKQLSPCRDPNQSLFTTRSDRLCHRLEMARNTILNRNPPGSFSSWTSRVSPEHRQQRNIQMYQQREPSNYCVSPSRVTKDEIENMSDQELASLIREQRVQVERFGVGLVHALENETPPPSAPPPSAPPSVTKSVSTPLVRPKENIEQPTERREYRQTVESKTYPASPSEKDNLLLKPSVDQSELILLRSQLAQSLGREDELRDLLRKEEGGSGQADGFEEAVVECIEDLNNELEGLAQERELEEYDNYESVVYESLLSDVDHLILQARKANSPAKRLHETATLTMLSPPPLPFASPLPAAPAVSSLSAFSAPLPLSRGLQSLSGNLSHLSSGNGSSTAAANSSFFDRSIAAPRLVSVGSRKQRTVAVAVRQPPPPSGNFIRIPSLGMDASGNITVE